MRIEKLLPGVKKNVSLKNYTTFKIGGRADYFFTAKTKLSLIKAVKVAKKYNLPLFILGGGSNILVSDRGYKGLVIQVKNQKLKVKNNNIFAEAGVALDRLVNLTLKNSLTGLEWALGIPGTVGGAVWGNAGAFGISMKDIIKKVEVFDIKKNKIIIFKNKNCGFTYRESIFKKNHNLVILACFLQLESGSKIKIKEKTKKYLDYRKKRHPQKPSAGSVFKNLKDFPARDLITECGLKGKRVGGAEISKKHANFIINSGGAKTTDVLKLIKLIKERVKKKSGIQLEEEIQILK